jgi:hypothetical protein
MPRQKDKAGDEEVVNAKGSGSMLKYVHAGFSVEGAPTLLIDIRLEASMG